MLDKKQVLNVVFGVALVLAIISCFTFFMEFVNTIQIKDLTGELNYPFFNPHTWVSLVLGYGIPMILSILALVFYFVSHLKQNEKLKKVALILIAVTFIAMLILSIFSWFIMNDLSSRIDTVTTSFVYTLMYEIKIHAITAAASFAVLFGCLIIHAKTKNQE